MGENKSKPAQIVHARLPINRDVIDFLQSDPRFFEAIIDRAGWQTGPMLDPAESFLFRRRHEFAIDKQTRGGIAVVSVQAQDLHPKY